MPGIDSLDILFVECSFAFQMILIIHFALRKWRFGVAMRYGWIVYALSFLAGAISLVLFWGGKPWALWLGGFIYLIWGVFGYFIEYIKKIEWRTPIHWPVFGPYVLLYLATVMFYWWPLALISKPLWYIYAVLLTVSTILNVTSHQISPDRD